MLRPRAKQTKKAMAKTQAPIEMHGNKCLEFDIKCRTLDVKMWGVDG